MLARCKRPQAEFRPEFSVRCPFRRLRGASVSFAQAPPPASMQGFGASEAWREQQGSCMGSASGHTTMRAEDQVAVRSVQRELRGVLPQDTHDPLRQGLPVRLLRRLGAHDEPAQALRDDVALVGARRPAAQALLRLADHRRGGAAARLDAQAADNWARGSHDAASTSPRSLCRSRRVKRRRKLSPRGTLTEAQPTP